MGARRKAQAGDRKGLVRVPTEHEEQRAFVAWFRKTFPTTRIFAIPNGGKRPKLTAARLKAEGATRGVPDLFVPEWAMWIEMKRQKGGVVSPEQKDWHEYLGQFDTVFVARGCEDAKKQVIAWNQ